MMAPPVAILPSLQCLQGEVEIEDEKGHQRYDVPGPQVRVGRRMNEEPPAWVEHGDHDAMRAALHALLRASRRSGELGAVG